MLVITALLALVLQPQAARATQPPDLTLPPETASTVTILEGRGVQIYTCTAGPAGYSWTLTAPDAQLFNLATGKPMGHHGAGPTWTLDDGSAIRGTVLTRKAADTPDDVPWLLLKATAANDVQGTFTSVAFVRRYNTHGGAPPVLGCMRAQEGRTLRVPYSAMYAFYAIAPAEPLTPQPTSKE